LTAEEANAMWAGVARAVDSWRVMAKGLGMRPTDIVDFDRAFP